MNLTKDEGLSGNEAVEQAIYALQQEATQEQLAHTLTVIRRRMKAHGQLIAAVEPGVSGQMQPRVIRTADGKSWWDMPLPVLRRSCGVPRQSNPPFWQRSGSCLTRHWRCRRSAASS